MNALKAIVSAAALGAAFAAVAAPADEALDRAVIELRHAASERGAWVNPHMPHGTGRYAAESADRLLAATLRVYTRKVLDRGGWFNPYMAEQHYGAGHALLAARPGEGVTSRVAGSAVAVVAQAAATTSVLDPTVSREAPDACVDAAEHLRRTGTTTRIMVVAEKS